MNNPELLYCAEKLNVQLSVTSMKFLNVKTGKYSYNYDSQILRQRKRRIKRNDESRIRPELFNSEFNIFGEEIVL
jgi:hypothetical protein